MHAVVLNSTQQMASTPLFMTESPTLEQIAGNPQLEALQSIVNEYEPEGGLQPHVHVLIRRARRLQQGARQRGVPEG
jgi:hypothetical protein